MMNSEKKNSISLEEIRQYSAQMQEAICKEELIYSERLEGICSRIIKDNIRIMMIAGPSGSGKTTTAHRLARILQGKGRAAAVISLDDFFMERERLPRLADGTYDYESVYALDIPAVRSSLHELLDRGHCTTPIFDFLAGGPSHKKRTLSLAGGTLIVEGLHGANPLITDGFDLDMRKLCVNVCTRVTENGRVLLNESDIRLIRRMVRDVRVRGTRPTDNFKMRQNILRGEREYIEPFFDLCEERENTFLSYELNIMAHCGLETLRELLSDPFSAQEGQRFCGVLEKLTPFPKEWIPKDSVLREFVGD